MCATARPDGLRLSVTGQLSGSGGLAASGNRLPSSLPGQFCHSLREQLQLGGIELRDPGQADYLLRLSNYRQDRRASAITAQASAAEYILRHTVAMELVTNNQVPLIATTDLNASETYRYDETNVLAKQREEDEIRQQLAKQLAQQVIFRLAPLSQQRIDALVQEHATHEGGPESP